MEAKPGTYVLIFQCPSTAIIEVGQWGKLIIQPGYYVYVGSAFGPGGVKARVQRHWRESKSLHWHIDYLRRHVVPVCVWYCYDTRDMEHKWADVFSKLETTEAIKGFGCSDCKCLSHLFRTLERPCRTYFCGILGNDIKISQYIATG